eukprot:285247-Rhodomonas_salina.1
MCVRASSALERACLTRSGACAASSGPSTACLKRELRAQLTRPEATEEIAHEDGIAALLLVLGLSLVLLGRTARFVIWAVLFPVNVLAQLPIDCREELSIETELEEARLADTCHDGDDG